MLSVLLHVGGTFGSAFAPNYAAFLALRFIVGMSNMGLFMSTFVIGKNFFYKKMSLNDCYQSTAWVNFKVENIS